MLPIKRNDWLKEAISEGKLPKFDRFQDNFNGMGITVHDTWATHITIQSLRIIMIVTGLWCITKSRITLALMLMIFQRLSLTSSDFSVSGLYSSVIISLVSGHL